MSKWLNFNWFHEFFKSPYIKLAKNMPELDISKIVQLDFPSEQYMREEYPKRQIVLHHTASGRGIDGDFSHWLNTPHRIATAFIIGYDGVIYQLFSSKYWGHHLGIKQSFLSHKGFEDYQTRNATLNKEAIGIEIDAWGGLKEKFGTYYAYPQNWTKEVPRERVVPMVFREFDYYERYTEKQIEAVRQLLVYLGDKYSIPLRYNEADMWEVNMNALKGVKGVFSHTSYREDKTDVFPQVELIDMLKNLQ